MSKLNFGHAAARPTTPVEKPNPATSEGLVEISRREGWLAAVAASAELATKTGIRQEVDVVMHNGVPAYVRSAKDQPRDPRTLKQRNADYMLKKHLARKERP